MVNGGGTIDDSGLFTADDITGTFDNTIEVETTQGEITRGDTASVTIGAGINATVILEGGLRTEEGMDIPLTMKFYDKSTVLNFTNILTEPPLYTFTRDSGHIVIINNNIDTKVVTFTVKGLPTGTFNITLVSPHTLIHLKNGVVLGLESVSLNMGALLEGNPDNSVQIAGSDFSLLLNDYLATPASGDWNGGRCDFDRSGEVTSLDFALLCRNYIKT
ncbi:hypothetical protein ACFLXC_00790 [Chloroflexota bacterium]